MALVIDMTGQVFGKLTVISLSGYDRRGAIWLCSCECGNKKDIARPNLIRRDRGTASCGCFKPMLGVPHRPSLKKGEAGFNLLMSQYRGSAKKRGYEFKLSNEQFRIITESDCHYCGCRPSRISWGSSKVQATREHAEYHYNGIDRIENSIGYISTNCVACCTTCNKMKLALDVDVFIKHIDKIYKNLTR